MAATVGGMAPEFALKNSRGEEIRLADLRGRKRALLVFYPQDLTSG